MDAGGVLGNWSIAGCFGVRTLKGNRISAMLQVKRLEGMAGRAFWIKCGELAPAARALAGWQVGGRHRFDSSFILPLSDDAIVD
jgi:hypothetical protein